jgi:hypothetical protein
VVTFRLLGRYFVGDSHAIATLANCRPALWLGAIFVLSAGFAREYDGEDLISEPWHLLLPLAASLVSSLLLYGLLFVASWRRSDVAPRFLADYRRFLTLYWLTAPLAWVYAIPVEQFLSAPDAVRANFWLLGLVSLWRVLLISQAAAVLFGCRYRAALLLVLLFADTLVLAILWGTPMPVFSIMGGVRLTESEGIIQATHFTVMALGFVTWPVWAIAGIVILAKNDKGWELLPRDGEANTISRVVWLLAAASLLVWTFILPFTQPPQQLRHSVEQMFAREQIGEAVRLMSSRDRKDFPRLWDPPPRIGYGEKLSRLIEAVSYSAELSPENWTRAEYIEKLSQQLSSNYYLFEMRPVVDAEIEILADVLKRLPELHAAAREPAMTLREQLNRNDELTEQRVAAIESILNTLGIPLPTPKGETTESQQ